ncbi:hypothetical protein O6H91_07G118000 [Diphasiastrum complanatum]|uniref:Uncharacterized protein n=1 Tax=Diphasiastrum complanatum TaxID=34168 RepID=A0ACC2D9E4_DIPCM|nr:hypothetical protein O6H91_07G118000 [Diphasiastrum complanatum]
MGCFVTIEGLLWDRRCLKDQLLYKNVLILGDFMFESLHLFLNPFAFLLFYPYLHLMHHNCFAMVILNVFMCFHPFKYLLSCFTLHISQDWIWLLSLEKSYVSLSYTFLFCGLCRK